MRTTQQTVGRKEPNNTGSASESGKTVLIKKRSSKSSRSVNSDNVTVTYAIHLNIEHRRRRISMIGLPYERMNSTGSEEAVMGKIKQTGSKPNARYCQQDEKT